MYARLSDALGGGDEEGGGGGVRSGRRVDGAESQPCGGRYRTHRREPRCLTNRWISTFVRDCAMNFHDAGCGSQRRQRARSR
jgi:hypothetical protein